MVKGLSALNSLLQFFSGTGSKTWQTLFSTSCLLFRFPPLKELDEDPTPGGEGDLLFPSTLCQDGPSFWHQLPASFSFPRTLFTSCLFGGGLHVLGSTPSPGVWVPAPGAPPPSFLGASRSQTYLFSEVCHPGEPHPSFWFHKPKSLSAFCSARFQGLPIVMIFLLALVWYIDAPFPPFFVLSQMFNKFFISPLD